MKLDVSIRTVVTEEEWNTLVDASKILDQLRQLLQDYEDEASRVFLACEHLEEVMENIIDDYE